jgi:hypothetical protein
VGVAPLELRTVAVTVTLLLESILGALVVRPKDGVCRVTELPARDQLVTKLLASTEPSPLARS